MNADKGKEVVKKLRIAKENNRFVVFKFNQMYERENLFEGKNIEEAESYIKSLGKDIKIWYAI